jgi:carbamoyl-phosphate synthase large subunit
LLRSGDAVSLGNFLVTSSGDKVPLLKSAISAARKVSKGISVFAGDISSEVSSKFFCDFFWEMPPLSAETVAELIHGCRVRGIRFILPTRDGELVFWAENRELFKEEGIHVFVSSPSTVQVCLDKLAFHDHCCSNGIVTIPTSGRPPRAVGQKYVIKERYGAGSRSLCITDDHFELERHALSLRNPIFQPYYDGNEFSLDAYVTETGRVFGMVCRLRLRVINGESVITETFRSEGAETLSSLLLQSIDFYGPVVIQGFISGSTVTLMECNPRFGGCSTTSASLGLDLIYLLLFEACFGESMLPEFSRPEKNVRLIRHSTDRIDFI